MVKKKIPPIALVLTSVSIIHLFSGIQYSWSVIAQALIAEYGFTNTQASFTYTLLALSGAFSGSFAGAFGERFSPRLGAILGATLLGGGLFLLGVIKNPIIVPFTTGVTMGCASALITRNTTPAVIKIAPPEKRGVFAGICEFSWASSAVFTSPIIAVLISSWGITRVTRNIGVIVFVVIVISSVFLRTPQQNRKNEPEKAINEYGVRHALKNTYFWKLWFMCMASSVTGQIMTVQASAIARNQADWNDMGVLAGSLAAGSAIGRLGCSILSDKIGPLRCYRLSFVVQAINLSMFVLYKTPFFLILGMFIAGTCYGAGYPLVTLATSEYFGTNHVGSVSGAICSASGIAGIFGPLIAAGAFETLGSFTPSYYLAVTLLMMGFFISRKQQKLIER